MGYSKARSRTRRLIALARQKECQIVAGHLMLDHVHTCIAVPPKYPVASVIGFFKEKSAIAMAARSVISRVGISGPVATPCPPSEQVRQYVREQQDADGTAGRF